jgi:2-polyprenyl-6-methoxyphenol hydroxylase-like FAD-dependent oxidoreductase
MSARSSTTDVLIVGAGPTGLVLALWLRRMGVAVRIVDKTDAPGTTSRALAVHARTLELYRQLDLTDAVLEAGHRVPGVNLWVQGKREARIDFTDVGASLTAYPFLEIFPQDEHERLLIQRLEALDVHVERRTTLTAFSDDGERVRAMLHGDAGESVVEARFIAGCDGARSTVRATLGTGFPGGTYQQVFYVADIEGDGPAVDGELHVDLDEADFLAVFPLHGKGRARLIGTVRDARAEHADTLTFADVQSRAIRNLDLDVRRINWFSTYHVHHRVAEHFRQGRAFLLGDAAHIHSPAGGQGMNTGIGDAINLAWKLKWVLDGRAGDSLLASYEPERIAFARKLVATTDRGFTLATAEGPLADFVRTRVVPIVLPAAAHVDAFREWAFRMVSQTMIEYRDSALSAGRAGSIHGGDRMPWLPETESARSLAAIAWQVHVVGAAPAPVKAWCATHGVAHHVLTPDERCLAQGFREGAMYVTRPDSYLALVDPAASERTLDAYFATRDIRP